MTVPVLPVWLGIDDILSMFALFHFADLAFLSMIMGSEGLVQLITLLVRGSLVWSSDEVWLL